MSNIQNDIRYDFGSNFNAYLKTQFPWLKNFVMGWPDQKFFQADTNFPAAALVDVSIKPVHAVSQYAVSGYATVNGQGQVLTEKMRLHAMMQLSLFFNRKLDRDQYGMQVLQWICSNQRLPMLDYTLATPAPVASGEAMLMFLRGDHEDPGSANFYPRHFTIEIQGRVLDATPGWQVQTVTEQLTTGRNAAPTLYPIPAKTVTSQSVTTDTHGNPVDTITET